MPDYAHSLSHTSRMYTFRAIVSVTMTANDKFRREHHTSDAYLSRPVRSFLRDITKRKSPDDVLISQKKDENNFLNSLGNVVWNWSRVELSLKMCVFLFGNWFSALNTIHQPYDIIYDAIDGDECVCVCAERRSVQATNFLWRAVICVGFQIEIGQIVVLFIFALAEQLTS